VLVESYQHTTRDILVALSAEERKAVPCNDLLGALGSNQHRQTPLHSVAVAFRYYLSYIRGVKKDSTFWLPNMPGKPIGIGVRLAAPHLPHYRICGSHPDVP
jgi:hypothetical protein